MMRTKKSVVNGKTKRKEWVFDDFLACSDQTEKKKNQLFVEGDRCDMADGKLSASDLTVVDYKVEGYSLPLVDGHTDVSFIGKSITHAGEEITHIFYADENYQTYAYNFSTHELTADVSFSAMKKPVYYYDSMGARTLVLCGDDGVHYYSLYGKQLLLAKGSVVACSFHERIFVASGQSIYFSAPNSYSVWADSADEGGKIDLPCEDGEILGLVPLGETVYLFFDRAIHAMKVRGSARDFVVERLCPAEIFAKKGEFCTANGKIYFLGTKGLFSFDGNAVKKEFAPRVPIASVSGIVAWGNRVFCSWTNEQGEYKVFVFDAYYLRAYETVPNVSHLCFTENTLFCVHQNKIRSLCKGAARSVACDVEIHDPFGEKKWKLIKKITVEGEGSCGFSVSNGSETHTKPLAFASGENTLFPMLKGKEFTVCIHLNVGAKIHSIRVETVETERG